MGAVERSRERQPIVDEAVKEIIRLMLAGDWYAGSSHLELGAKYVAEPSTVQKWAAEASRFIRLCRGNEDEIREALLVQLDHFAKTAKQDVKTITKADGSVVEIRSTDRRGGVAALELQTRVLGINGSGGIGAGGYHGAQQIDVTIGELRAVVEPLGYELRRKDGSDSDETGTAEE